MGAVRRASAPEVNANAGTESAREDLLAQGLTQLATRLAQELQGLDGDGRLRRAVVDLPDARGRLNAVAQLMEEAAHKTLDLVEVAQRDVRKLKTHTDPEVAAVAESLSQTFVQLAETQGFQDLSGQIIARVHRILESMQDGLQDLIARAGLAPPTLEDGTPEEALAGPQVAGLERDDTASQDDADALLQDLGL